MRPDEDSISKCSHEHGTAECEPSYVLEDDLDSPRHKEGTAKNELTPVVSTTDRVCNIIALALLFMILVTSLISIAAGASCLASVSNKPFKNFTLFAAFGITPVVLGVLCFVTVIVVILFVALCAMGLKNYGMCCYGATRIRGCLRVCLYGVLPLIIFLLLLILCITGFSFYSLSQQLPPLNKNYMGVQALTGPVDIVRDENGLTHIKASSRRDAFFGQGFASAQDRLFQLEFHRLTAKGELSSAVGKSGVSTDTSIRTLNVRDAAYALCDKSSPEERDLLEAFAEGVNLYMERCSKRPVEFFFMSTTALRFRDPEPFTANDMCLTARLFQWQMSSNVANEGDRFAVWTKTNRTYSQTENLFPNFTDVDHTIMNQDQMLHLMDLDSPSLTPEEIAKALEPNIAAQRTNSILEGGVYDLLFSYFRVFMQNGHGPVPPTTTAAPKAASTSTTATSPEDPVLVKDTFATMDFSSQQVVGDAVADVMQEHFFTLRDSNVFAFKYLDASNAWATRDATGKAMAASDPHLTTNLPSIWYYVHLSFPTDDGIQFDAAGVAMIGLPGVHIGRTTHIAWGITMSKTDLEDFFILPPQSLFGVPPRTYYYDNELRVYVARRERIKVKGQEDIVMDVDDTVFGPIVTDMFGFPKSLDVALYATPLRQTDDTSIGALLAMSDPRTDTAEKLMNSLLLLQAPGFSIPIADVHGNIAYAVTGKHPLRPSGHTGKYPSCGFDCVKVLEAVCSILTDGVTPLEDCLETYYASPDSNKPPNLDPYVSLLPSVYEGTKSWRTYASTNPATIPDKRIPPNSNPHVSMPFDGTIAYISAANQKILPDGYPYFFGADYGWKFRGARLQELLDAHRNELELQSVHMEIQMDDRSNIWAMDFRPLVESADFQKAIADDDNARYWSKRLLNWNAMASIGNVEIAFYWRWMQRMCVVPQDAIKAMKLEYWEPRNRYIQTMLSSSATPLMLKDCATALGRTTFDSASCFDFAVAMFKQQATNRQFKEEWGRDINQLEGVHEMLSDSFLSPVFQRIMSKAGDVSSLAVSDGGIVGNMLSQQASSMRQLYDLWNNTGHVYYAIPGGNSGNPYSDYYQNLWDLFEQQQYVHVVTSFTTWPEMKVAHSQTISI